MVSMQMNRVSGSSEYDQQPGWASPHIYPHVRIIYIMLNKGFGHTVIHSGIPGSDWVPLPWLCLPFVRQTPTPGIPGREM